MTTLRFTVPGEPRGKGRPRFGRSRAGFAVAYTDDKTAAYENLVKLAARQAGAALIEGAVAISVVAYLGIPKSAPKRRRAAMLSGVEYPTRKPDLDNCIKALLDGLNGVCFGDDSQCTDISVCKRWSDQPRLEVSVWPALASAAKQVAA